MLPHSLKRGFHFASEDTPVAQWRRYHERAQGAAEVVQASRTTGERESDLHVLLDGVGNQIRQADLAKQAGANPSGVAITP